MLNLIARQAPGRIVPDTGIPFNDPSGNRLGAWKEYWLDHLPHPSPRDNLWLKKNIWFEEEILVKLKNIISKLIG